MDSPRFPRRLISKATCDLVDGNAWQSCHVPLRSRLEVIVRDVYIVLREKEEAIEQVRREVEALRSVSPLLADARSNALQVAVRMDGRTQTASRLGEALRTVAALLVDETEDLDPEVRARLVEAAENGSKIGRAKQISRQLRHLAIPFAGC